MTPQDIGTVPPTDTNGEMEVAFRLLKRFRKSIGEELHGKEWQVWLAKSLLSGIEKQS